MKIVDQIIVDLPNFPAEIIEEWLKPFAEERGWPPCNNEWNGIMKDKPLDYWKNIIWKKQLIKMCYDDLTPTAQSLIDQMRKAYVNKEDNFCNRFMGTGGNHSFVASLKYLMEYGNFPKSPIFMKENNKYEILDGNHRFLALIVWKECCETLDKITGEEKDKHLEIIKNGGKLSKISKPNIFQEVWIGS